MKKFIIKRGPWNRIGYRKLDAFEKRNGEWFAVSHKAFDAWEEAHAFLLETRSKELAEAKRSLKAAERSLAAVTAMEKPETA